MKKILIIVSILLVGFTSTLTASEEVQAETPEIVWTIFNPVGSYYMIQGDADLWESIKSFKFTIPESKYHTLTTGGLVPQINFYDTNGVGLDPIMWLESLGDSVTGEFEIDLEAFGLEDAVRFTILIPQNFSTPPAGYSSFLELNDSFEMLYFITDRDYYFMREETTYYTRLIAYVNVPFNTYTVTLNLTDINYSVIYDEVYLSKLILYNEDDTAMTQLYFEDNIVFDQNIIRIDIPEGSTQEDLTYFAIYLYVEPDITFQEIDFINKNLTIDYNNLDDLIIVQYYSLDELVNEELVFTGHTLPEFEPTAPEGYTFINWFFDNGDTIHSYTAITSDRAINGVVTVSAYFKASILLDTPDIDDPVAEETQGIVIILSSFGMNSTTGFIIFYVIVAFGFTIVLIVLDMSNLIISIVNLLILVLFTFWNILPLYVTVSGYILYFLAILMSLSTKGGRGYE